jgi:hypothetical protein
VSGEAAWYQPEYVQRIEDAAEDLGLSKSYSFRFNGRGSSLATIGNDMIVVIMPMRDMVTADTIGTEWVYSDLPQPEAQPEAQPEITV